jgi:uncharacterized RDD family membrane protein YckC
MGNYSLPAARAETASSNTAEIRDRVMSGISKVLIIALVTVALIIPAGAHVPGIAAGQVTEVPDAAKSFAWYGTLEDTD